ncbi:MAG TPA: hypothetical protein VLJ76_08265 [Gaiellaceae bacterium]|nr:hypothetical protein [Gaiellaceae bacterium]
MRLIAAGAERLQDRAGQVLAEYAVILGVITLAVVAALSLFAVGVNNAMNAVVSAF